MTCDQALVEVDTDVRSKCLDVESGLKDEFRSCCLIQLCVFQQEPTLSKGINCSQGMVFPEGALAREGVDVLRISPYVEEKW